MTEAAKAARAAYQHEWYINHREQKKDYTRLYWERKAAEAAAAAQAAESAEHKSSPRGKAE